jgi:hypothetical protein
MHTLKNTIYQLIKILKTNTIKIYYRSQIQLYENQTLPGRRAIFAY